MVGQNLIAKKSLPVKSLRKGIRGRERERKCEGANCGFRERV